MIKKLGLLSLLLLIPTLASAGLIYSSTAKTTKPRGTISPLGYTSTPSTGTTIFTVTPLAGYTVGSVTLDGVPLAATGLNAGGKTYTVPNKVGQQKVVAGFVASSAPALVATLSTPLTVVRDAVTKNYKPLVISGAASTISLPATVQNVTYSWSVTPVGPILSKTGGTAESSSDLTTTFTFSTPGVYTVTLSLVGGNMASSASTTVIMQTDSIVMSKACVDCHANKYAQLAASTHFTTSAKVMGCPNCHNPGLLLPHPGNKATAAGITSECLTCHAKTTYPVAPAIGQSPHLSVVDASATKALFGQFTATGILPSRITTNNSCSTCHAAHSIQNIVNQRQWGTSKHGNTQPTTIAGGSVFGAPQVNAAGLLQAPGTDFKFKGAVAGVTYDSSLSPTQTASEECVRCHTTTGFVNFFTSGYKTIQAWGVAGDKTKEVITCAACHNDAKTIYSLVSPFGPLTSIVRKPVAAWKPYLGYSTPVNQRSGTAEIPAKFALISPYDFTVSSLGKSDICVSCHSPGGENKVMISGNLIKKLNTFNSYSVVRADVNWGIHGNTIASVPYLTDNGFVYKFDGKSYVLGTHGKVGTVDKYLNPVFPATGAAGPCAGCHLNSDKTNVMGGHTFKAWKNFSSVANGDGYKTVCLNCHFVDVHDLLTAAKTGAFAAQTSVKRVLRKSLNLDVNNDLVASATNPIRFYTGLGNFTKANAKNLQGANLNAGMPNNSWWLHGPAYTRQLLFDSLDAALHGVPTGSIADITTASGYNLTQEQITRARDWFGNNYIRP